MRSLARWTDVTRMWAFHIKVNIEGEHRSLRHALYHEYRSGQPAHWGRWPNSQVLWSNFVWRRESDRLLRGH